MSVSIHSGVSGAELDEEALGKTVRRSEDKSLYKKVLPGDIVFNMMRAWQGAIGVEELLPSCKGAILKIGRRFPADTGSDNLKAWAEKTNQEI